MSVVIFVATHNRIDTLERTIRSYRRFDAPYEVVIIDNGTDHPLSLEKLEKLERWPEVSKVYSLNPVNSMDELTDNYNRVIGDWYDSYSKPKWFVVADADISFEASDRTTLSSYVRLARRINKAVGPHTRVDEHIPIGYPLRSRVIATETRILYRNSMYWYMGIPYSGWPIDTTFLLFPRQREFRRLKMDVVRVGYPFDAMHLDWYIDLFNPTPENQIYASAEYAVGSWGRSWLRDFWQAWSIGPEEALNRVLRASRAVRDLCNSSFMLSWLYQYGLPSADIDESKKWLYAAVPQDSIWWNYYNDWTAMIYDNDFTSLGWE